VAANDAYAYRRAQMVDSLTREGISNQRVLEAMAAVPRHFFVPEAFRHQA
jgi:protein-L-isoaspartate O-methyltransferase